MIGIEKDGNFSPATELGLRVEGGKDAIDEHAVEEMRLSRGCWALYFDQITTFAGIVIQQDV